MPMQKHPINGLKYQRNVAAILQHADGRVLIGERVGMPGAWQFPQGGVDTGETLEQAMQREMWEEIGILPESYRLTEKRGPYYYAFPPGVGKRGHQGKEQTYFRCAFHGNDARINVATEHPEFRAWRWVEPREFQLAWLPPMKVEVYRQVFVDFFGLKLA